MLVDPFGLAGLGFTVRLGDVPPPLPVGPLGCPPPPPPVAGSLTTMVVCGVSAFCPGPVQSNIRELGKLRPEKYKKDTGLEEFEKQLAQRPTSDLWMDAVECGNRVVRGIQRNDLYIFTHPEFKAGAKERMDKMLASFPDEPINQPRAAAISFLLSNPIFK